MRKLIAIMLLLLILASCGVPQDVAGNTALLPSPESQPVISTTSQTPTPSAAPPRNGMGPSATPGAVLEHPLSAPMPLPSECMLKREQLSAYYYMMDHFKPGFLRYADLSPNEPISPDRHGYEYEYEYDTKERFQKNRVDNLRLGAESIVNAMSHYGGQFPDLSFEIQPSFRVILNGERREACEVRLLYGADFDEGTEGTSEVRPWSSFFFLRTSEGWQYHYSFRRFMSDALTFVYGSDGLLTWAVQSYWTSQNALRHVWHNIAHTSIDLDYIETASESLNGVSMEVRTQLSGPQKTKRGWVLDEPLTLRSHQRISLPGDPNASSYQMEYDICYIAERTDGKQARLVCSVYDYRTKASTDEPLLLPTHFPDEAAFVEHRSENQTLREVAASNALLEEDRYEKHAKVTELWRYPNTLSAFPSGDMQDAQITISPDDFIELMGGNRVHISNFMIDYAFDELGLSKKKKEYLELVVPMVNSPDEYDFVYYYEAEYAKPIQLSLCGKSCTLQEIRLIGVNDPSDGRGTHVISVFFIKEDGKWRMSALLMPKIHWHGGGWGPVVYTNESATGVWAEISYELGYGTGFHETVTYMYNLYTGALEYAYYYVYEEFPWFELFEVQREFISSSGVSSPKPSNDKDVNIYPDRFMSRAVLYSEMPIEEGSEVVQLVESDLCEAEYAFNPDTLSLELRSMHYDPTYTNDLGTE